MQKPWWLFNSGTLFAGLLMLVWLGACAKVTVTCPPAGGGGGGQNEEAPGGCNLTNWANQSATGFVGIGGASPVPSTPAYTCDGTSVKCANENQSGCSLRYPNKKCRSTFTYPGGGGTTGPCACQCIN